MVKYKLIKEYPGSPDLGWISNNNWKGYPEFWEEVKELTLLEEARLRYPIGTKFKSVQYDSGIKICKIKIK